MSLFAVIREAGPTWQAGGILQQPSVTEHAAFMNTLADQRFVLFEATGQIHTVSIEPWKILVGAERLSSPHNEQPAVASHDHVIGSRSPGASTVSSNS